MKNQFATATHAPNLFATTKTAAAQLSKRQRVSISCPHCWGTGDLRLFDSVEAKHKRDCIFCEGSGKLHIEVSL